MTNSHSNTNFWVFFGMFVLTTAAAPPGCRAAGATVNVSGHVSYAGIDLNTPEGARALYVRLKNTARSLCETSDPVERAPSWVYRECIEDALARAVLNANRLYITEVFVHDYGIQAATQYGIASGTHVAKQ